MSEKHEVQKIDMNLRDEFQMNPIEGSSLES